MHSNSGIQQKNEGRDGKEKGMNEMLTRDFDFFLKKITDGIHIDVSIL